MTKKVIFLAVILSLVLRLFIIYNSKLTFYADDAIYAEIARFWTQGKLNLVFHPTWPPLYPFLTFIAHIVLNNWENSARVVSAIAGSLIIIPLYFFAKKFLPTVAAVLFSVSIILVGPIFKMSVLPQSDMLATTMVISAMTLFLYKRYYLSSAFFGLAYLTRSEGLMFFGLSLVFLILFVRNIKLAAIFLFLFLIVISPYLISLKIQTGSFSLSQKGSAQIKQGQSFQLVKGTTWIQEVDSVKGPNYKSSYFKGGLTHVLEYSDWFWFWFVQKAGVWKGVLLKNIPPWALALSVLGVMTVFAKKLSRDIFYILFLGVPGITLTIFATPLADIRYLLWAFPLIIMFIYLGVLNIFRTLTENKLIISATLVGILILFLLPAMDFTTITNPKAYAQDFTNHYWRPEIEEAGLWLKDNSKNTNPKIMARHEGVEFYSDGETIYTPQELTLDKVLEYADEKGTTYIIAAADEISNDKNLEMLLNESFRDTRLKKVYVTNANGRTIIIYETSFDLP